MATQAVAEEIARHLPRLAAKRGLDETLLAAALQVMPIEWKPEAEYKSERAAAEALIGARDPDDWPTVALALKREVPIWSQDKDLDDTGLHLYTTGELLDTLRHEAATDARAE